MLITTILLATIFGINASSSLNNVAVFSITLCIIIVIVIVIALLADVVVSPALLIWMHGRKSAAKQEPVSYKEDASMVNGSETQSL